jgi:hypothetical protein
VLPSAGGCSWNDGAFLKKIAVLVAEEQLVPIKGWNARVGE